LATTKKSPQTGKALVKWDEELAKRAQAATAAADEIGSGGNIIGTAGGQLKFRGAPVPGNKMNVVILVNKLHNMYYEGAFDPANPASPVCYAFGDTKDEMRPHEKSPKPQHATCKGCPQNEFGTADRGKGKACKNSERLGLITEGDLQDVVGAEAAFIHIPVTSMKGFAAYIRQVADTLKRPPLGVVTELALVPDPKNQFAMTFRLVEPIDDPEVLGAIIEKEAAVSKELPFPYVQIEAAPAVPARGRAALAGKKKF
jgi:hypothetical protein